ncbi:MAG: flavin reductase [Coriobacteriia bacterium]|nr:flavin reductase [Coriobacteriia bacterium]
MEASMRTEGPSFAQLFRQISPEEIADNVFKLVGSDLYVVTAGTREHYNSMAASGGGLGVHLMKPTTWCTLRADRYTLELLEESLAYTVSYFPDDHKPDLFAFGKESGRDGRKMAETELTALQTPSGSMTFEQARMVIDCRLMEITTPAYDDFRTPEARAFVEESFKKPEAQRKLVFGEITQVWVKR